MKFMGMEWIEDLISGHIMMPADLLALVWYTRKTGHKNVVTFLSILVLDKIFLQDEFFDQNGGLKQCDMWGHQENEWWQYITGSTETSIILWFFKCMNLEIM